MVNDAHVFLAGYVATEPALWKTASGLSHTKLRVAYTSRRQNRDTGEWSDGPTTFVTVHCWRTLADNVAMCLRKGAPVLVRGRIQVRQYETAAGEPRTDVEVDASSVGHDLSRGVAHFSRTRWTAAETAAVTADADGGAGAPAGNGPAGGASPAAGAVLTGQEDGHGDGAAQDGHGDGAGQDGAHGGTAPVAAGNGPGDVVDEAAVQEFARELGTSLAGEEAQAGVPA